MIFLSKPLIKLFNLLLNKLDNDINFFYNFLFCLNIYFHICFLNILKNLFILISLIFYLSFANTDIIFYYIFT